MVKKTSKASRRMKDTLSQKRRKKKLSHFAGKAQPMEFCHKVRAAHTHTQRHTGTPMHRPDDETTTGRVHHYSPQRRREGAHAIKESASTHQSYVTAKWRVTRWTDPPTHPAAAYSSRGDIDTTELEQQRDRRTPHGWCARGPQLASHLLRRRLIVPPL